MSTEGREARLGTIPYWLKKGMSFVAHAARLPRLGMGSFVQVFSSPVQRLSLRRKTRRRINLRGFETFL